MTYRILVTGSRDWDDVDRIRDELGNLWLTEYPARLITLVSGHCPTGADKIAEDIVLRWGWNLELHPAEWHLPNGDFDRGAGLRRNREMVALGANVCIAFIKNESIGATYTARRAERAGIRTIRIRTP